jgi:superfamily II DNA or RNA helicase
MQCMSQRNAARLRTNELSKDRRNDSIAETSPSLQAKKIEILTAENKRLQKIVRKARHKLVQMNEKKQCIFTANVDHNQVFREDLHGLAAEYFYNKDIPQEDFTRVILNECNYVCNRSAAQARHKV